MELEKKSSLRTSPKTDDEIIEIMKAHTKSGLTMKDFAEKNGYSLPTFHSWRSRLKKMRGTFVKVSNSDFASARYQLVLKNGILEFSGLRLSTVLRDLQESGLC